MRAEPLAPGERLGRYELVREIGRGAFGVVYEARDLERGRGVALKVVHPGCPEEGGSQLLREADVVARLSHPNLVALLDVGRCAQGPFLVLELLRGATLEQRLTRGPVPRAEALAIAVDVARGLAHAHAQGVIHRDLKPSNVFLCDGGQARLLDFGLCHAFGRRRAEGGTPAYMAPEQWRGAPEDERTDVFALGVMLHRLLSGRLPFGGAEPAGARRPLPELVVPRALELGPLLARMLALDPAERPREVAGLIEPLERARAAVVRAGPGEATGRIRRRRSFRRLRRPAGAAAAIAASALVAAIALRVLRREEGPATALGARATAAARAIPAVAVLPFTDLPAGAGGDDFAAGIGGELISQLAGLSGLRAIARGSVESYRPGRRDLPAIGAALGVGAVVEGTARRAGGRVELVLRLLEPATGREIWSARYDRDEAGLYAVQATAALEIARALGASTTQEERRRVARAPTEDRRAHDLFLRAVYFWERSIGVEADNRAAAQLLGEALALDPRFALAHAWLAIVDAEWKGDCVGAQAHAARAIALAPDLPQAHAARGAVLFNCARDLPGAIDEYQEAVRGAPGDAVSRLTLGEIRTAAGHLDEGLADLRTAMAYDPRSYLVAVELARELAIVRRFDEAASVCQRARSLEPDDVHALALCALIPIWRDGDLGGASLVLAQLPARLPADGNGAWSLFQLLAFFPDRTLALVGAGGIGDPFSTRPFVPRDFLVGGAEAALGHPAAAEAAFARAAAELQPRVLAEPASVLLRLFRARAWAGAGRPAAALAELDRARALARGREETASVERYGAEIEAATGHRAAALASLAAVLRRRDGLITAASVRVDPRFAALRGDPRFDALVAPPAAVVPLARRELDPRAGDR